jgi:hypothetical protein
MKKLILTIALTLATALPAAAQKINLDFPELASKAAETVDVTLDGSMLQMAAGFLSKEDDREVRDMVQKLQGVYVRSYSFDHDNEYDPRVVDRVRAQLGAGWKKIVNVSKRDEKVEIYALPRGNTFGGLVVISSEPRELTVVNIVGPINMDQLSSLGGNFGIPKVDQGGKK